MCGRLFPLALIALAACSDEVEPPGRPDVVTVVERALLVDEAARTVEREHPERPVALESVDPGGAARSGMGPLPALVAAPPAVVHLDLPGDLPPGARLRYSTGLGESAFDQPQAAVSFVLQLDGRAVASASHPFGRGLGWGRRRWREQEVALDGVRRVTLVTELVSEATELIDVAEPIDAAWGRLEVVAPLALERRPPTAEHPSVVMIVIDTLRADRLGCYGYARPTSPEIDALAARGVRFERAYSSSPWTWPSTASLLTGLTPPEHGLVDYSACYLAHALGTLPESFRRAGYHTGGHSANPLVSASYNFDQGFDSFGEYGMVPTAEFLPRVLEWLEEHAHERSFLYLHITDPHGPYEPDPAIAGELVPEPPAGYEHGSTKELVRRRMAGEAVDEAQLALYEGHISALYDGEVRVADHAVGRVLRKLEELGLSDRTLVAITSDHGEEFLEHGRNGHTCQLYDELVRVPLILAGPGLPMGEVEARPVQNRFLPATLGRLAGVDTRSLEPEGDLLDEEWVARAAGEPILLTTSRGVWMTSDGREDGPRIELHGIRVPGFALDWAPLGPDDDDDRVRLFELERDPEMRHDVSSTDPTRVQALVDALGRWLERGRSRRPTGLDGGRSALKNLQDLGYAGDDEGQ